MTLLYDRFPGVSSQATSSSSGAWLRNLLKNKWWTNKTKLAFLLIVIKINAKDFWSIPMDGVVAKITNKVILTLSKRMILVICYVIVILTATVLLRTPRYHHPNWSAFTSAPTPQLLISNQVGAFASVSPSFIAILHSSFRAAGNCW